MKTKNIKTANYIIRMVKSVGKTKEYAIDIAHWYSMTNADDKEIIEYINLNW